MRTLACVSFAFVFLAVACGGSTGSSTLPTATAVREATPSPAPAASATATATPLPLPTNTPLPEPTTPPPPTTAPQPTQPPPPPSFNNNPLIRGVLLDFAPKTVTVQAGQLVTVTFRNEDQSVGHDLIFRVPGAPAGSICNGPCNYTLSFTAPAPGSYGFYCSIHESTGMTGTLIVVP
ncbi:MAG TPA: cupredoxin domain-containing protein [Dehalococcoidia bacterium]|nr:cupredoxin domain-containing protein [Dehalococcoidia bacterium]